MYLSSRSAQIFVAATKCTKDENECNEQVSSIWKWTLVLPDTSVFLHTFRWLLTNSSALNAAARVYRPRQNNKEEEKVGRKELQDSFKIIPKLSFPNILGKKANV